MVAKCNQVSSLSRMLPEKLRQALAEIPRMAIAYSGGLDSRFLCHAARLCGCEVLAIHARGPHIAASDSNWAFAWAKKRRLHLVTVEYTPLPYPVVASNGRERCYFCKKGLLERIGAIARTSKMILCDGGNADDLKSFRPGIRAVAEAGVLSPLALAGLGKKDIREIAAATGMDAPEQRARPCLLTRYAYGMPVDTGMLARLAAAEEEIGKLLGEGEGIPAEIDFRLRLAPEPLLQLEKPRDSLYAALGGILKKHGFSEYKIEITPRVSGFFDQ